MFWVYTDPNTANPVPESTSSCRPHPRSCHACRAAKQCDEVECHGQHTVLPSNTSPPLLGATALLHINEGKMLVMQP